jgi:hypothetical protein
MTPQVPGKHMPLKPIGYTLSYLTCRMGKLVPIWPQCTGPSFQQRQMAWSNMGQGLHPTHCSSAVGRRLRRGRPDPAASGPTCSACGTTPGAARPRRTPPRFGSGPRRLCKPLQGLGFRVLFRRTPPRCGSGPGRLCKPLQGLGFRVLFQRTPPRCGSGPGRLCKRPTHAAGTLKVLWGPDCHSRAEWRSRAPPH